MQELSSCLASGLLLGLASFGRSEEIHEEPISAFLFPGESIDLFFPEEFHLDMQKTLTFEGNIQNTSFTLPTTMEFWFDWIDGPTIVTTTPQVFTLLTVGTGANFRFFSSTDGTALTYDIPFCPPEVSIHWRNLGPGGPVSVSGVFTHECVPEPTMLLITPLISLIAPIVVCRLKALGTQD